MSTPPSLEERIDEMLYRNIGIGYAGEKPHNQNSPKIVKGRAEAQQAIRQLIEDEVRAFADKLKRRKFEAVSVEAIEQALAQRENA